MCRVAESNDACIIANLGVSFFLFLLFIKHTLSFSLTNTYERYVCNSVTEFELSFGNYIDHDYRVLHAYAAQQQDELSIKPGDGIRVLDSSNADWWEVENTETGQRGLVPSTVCDAPLSFCLFAFFYCTLKQTIIVC